MRVSKTQAIGERTKSIGMKTEALATHQSRLAILNKDPAYDYSFRRKDDFKEAEIDNYGWEPIGVGNSAGEAWALPFPVKTKGHRQLTYHDTVLCKRKKEVSRYFQREEDEKYNAQKNLILTAARSARTKLRQLDPNAQVIDDVKSSDGFRQRKGPSEEYQEEIISHGE